MNSAQVPLELLDPPAPTLDNFVAGRNGAALASLRAARAGGAGPSFLHLWGPAGCGRSHLLAAVTGASTTAGAAVPEFSPGQRLYAVDDVQALDAPGLARLFVLQDAVRQQAGCVLVTAADAPPARLGLREDVRTRLAWGLVFALEPLSEPERAAALSAYAQARGARVDEELVPYLLTRLPRDMRTLVAVLDSLDRYALARQRALTVPLLREWLQEGRP